MNAAIFIVGSLLFAGSLALFLMFSYSKVFSGNHFVMVSICGHAAYSWMVSVCMGAVGAILFLWLFSRVSGLGPGGT